MKVPNVYMTTNRYNKILYTGVTSNIINRIKQHKDKHYNGFTSRYNCDKLVFYREFPSMIEAIAFEKKIKSGNRMKKEKLINEMNPDWKDLSKGWYE
ncbi:MAG: GIY-YIG nuclease family protein [Aequorivita sp.]|nr:GIY-YIG nuclease family protein [Aequorivita sp.]